MKELTVDHVPDVERHALVHHAHEWVDGYSILAFLCERLLDLLGHDLLKLVQCVELTLKQNLLLCAARHVAALHCFVEELIEIDKTIGVTKKEDGLIKEMQIRLDIHDD